MEIDKDKISKRHLLIKKYLEEHSLVESNIRSFNDFVERRMQEIVNELSAGLSKEEEIEIRLGKVRIEKPNIIEADGSSHPVSPTEARLRNLTYSASVFLEISIKQGSQFETHDLEI